MTYTYSSTIAELIRGLDNLRKGELLDSNPSLKEVLEFLLGKVDNDIDEIESRLNSLVEEVVNKLNKPVSEVEGETIGKFKEDIDRMSESEAEEKSEEPSEPETRLSQPELDELVLEYETATKERQDAIEKLLEKYEKVKPSEVKQFIQKQKEILLESRKIEKSVSEKFADELAETGKTEEEKTIIKETVLKVINGEEIPNTVEAKEIKLKTEEFIEKHRAELEEERIQEINQAFEDAAANAPDGQDKLIIEYGKNIADLNSALTQNIDKDMTDVKVAMEANGVRPGVVAGAEDNVRTLVKAICTKPSKLKEIYEDIKSLDDAGLQQKYLPNRGEVRSFQSLIRAIDTDKEAVLNLQNMVNAKIKMVEGVGKLVSKFPGGQALVGKVSEQIGGMAIKEFLKGSMEIMVKEGLITGAKTVMQGVMLGSTSAAEAAGGSAVVTTIAGLFAALPPVAIAILAAMAAVFVYKIAYKIYDTLAGWIQSATGVNFLWGVRDTIAGWFGNGKFGKFVGTLGQFAFNSGASIVAGMSFILGPLLAMSLASMATIVAPVIIGMVSVFSIFQFFLVSPMIGSLVPPIPQATGGTCVPKSAPETSSAECKTDVKPIDIGYSKDTFKSKVLLWNNNVTGDMADKCFNDVVNKAICAGKNPKYVLWAWAHESGASNYTRYPSVADFGIISKAKNNFTEQINAFLKLDMGTACPGLDYWTSFGTNYLTGGCDPDKVVAGPVETNTGRKYGAEMLKTWNSLDLGSRPDNISYSTDGGQCETAASATSKYEYVESDGTVMECDAPVNSDGTFIGVGGSSSYDPSAVGTTAGYIEGECSVASKVIETKQCRQSWSEMQLKGPVINSKYDLGTICSAGCGPTSASMLLQSKNRTLTPDSVIFRKGSAYYNMYGEGSGLSQAKTELERYGFSGLIHKVGCSPDDVGKWICAGNAVMLRADSDLAGGGTTGHMLVAKAVSNGKVVVSDPYFPNSTPFNTLGAGHISPEHLTECLIIPVGSDPINPLKNVRAK